MSEAALDKAGTPTREARLPAMHSQALVGFLREFAAQRWRLRDLRGRYASPRVLDETNAERDESIRRETRFPDGPAEWSLPGPHFSVGNLLRQTPRRISTTHRQYDCIALTAIPDAYPPRTKPGPGLRGRGVAAADLEGEVGGRRVVLLFVAGARLLPPRQPRNDRPCQRADSGLRHRPVRQQLRTQLHRHGLR